MCGLNGIFAYRASAPPPDAKELLATRDAMTARGPDGAGEWWSEDQRTGLGHRRLSILDLSARAGQPMTSDCGRFTIVFNGEIYNYPDLRSELEGQGIVFRTTSDTEVILHLFARYGLATPQRLRGMFAFAIWDTPRRRLFLARDPYGIKPLYTADDGKTFRFASQVKALLAGGAVENSTDPAGLVGFYVLGSVPEPLTIVKGVSALPAGATLVVDTNGPGRLQRYHSISGTFVAAEQSALATGDRRSAMRSALLDSVKHHLLADVPVGAFLSAGIDSSALVGLMRDAGQADIQTVTLTFSEFENSPDDEGPLAADVARTYETRHTNRVVTRAEFEAELPRILAAMDQPSIDGVNTFFVAKAAKELGLKVAISGLGGDELLGGYPSFRQIPRWVAWLKGAALVPRVGVLARRALTAIGPERVGLSSKAAGLLEYGGTYGGAWLLRRGLYMPWELQKLLDEDVIRAGLERFSPLDMINDSLDPMPRSRFARIASLESGLYMRNQLLRDTDWASMAHSLEVRTPLADSVLLQAAAALGAPPSSTIPKLDLAMAPGKSLPRSILERRKTGFGIPVGAWLSGGSPPKTASAYGYSRSWALSLTARHRSSLTAVSGSASDTR